MLRKIRRNTGARARHAAVTALLTVTMALGLALPMATSPAEARPLSQANRAEQALQLAKTRYVGKVQYRWGGTSPRTGFDCSGMVQYAFKSVGVKLPRTASQMRSATKRISRSQAKPGDLVFFSRGGRVYHVAIYAGSGRIVEAANARTDIVYRSRSLSGATFGRVSAG